MVVLGPCYRLGLSRRMRPLRAAGLASAGPGSGPGPGPPRSRGGAVGRAGTRGGGAEPLLGPGPPFASRRAPGTRAGPTRCGAESGGRGAAPGGRVRGLPSSEVGAGKELVPRPGGPLYGGQGDAGDLGLSRLGSVSAGP